MDEKIIEMIRKNKVAGDQEDSWEEQLDQFIIDIKNLEIELEGELTELEKISFFDERLSAYMPKIFKEMPEFMKKKKYLAENRPQFIYHNKKKTVNIGFTLAEIDEGKDQLLVLRDGMKDALVTVHPTTKIYDSGDFFNDENQVAYYTFNSHAIGGQMFNLIYITFLEWNTEEKNKVLVGSLNCLKKDMEKLKLFFYGFMNSIEVNSVD